METDILAQDTVAKATGGSLQTLKESGLATNHIKQTKTASKQLSIKDQTRKVSTEYQTLNIIISSGRSRDLLGKDITVKDLDAMDQDTIKAYYKISELNYSSKISEGIVSSIIGAYAKVVNKVLPIDDVQKFEQDLNNDYILTSELKNVAGSLSTAYGKFMSLFSLSFITFKHIKMQPKEQCAEISDTVAKATGDCLTTNHNGLLKKQCEELTQ